jgi:hypothetical protein
MKKYLLSILYLLILALPSLAQNIAGIGAQLMIDTAGGFTMPRIISLVQKTPAWDSLKPNDYIISVNDISCRNKTIEEVVSLIRGEAGSIVKIAVADTKQGARTKEYNLKRVSMQIADPATAFYANCDNEAKQLKRNGATIIKTYNSDCGNFFFNFDAGNGSYHIRITTLAENPDGTNPPRYTLSAKVFDSDHESDAITFGNPETKDGISQLDGTVTFTRNCVGVVSLNITGDLKKCLAMYVMVYK